MVSAVFNIISIGLLAIASVNGAPTAANLGPSAVDLGTAGNYAILSQSGVSTVPDSAITGDIGVSPIDATGLTGFSLTVDSGGTFSTSTQVTGQLFAASYTSPTPSTLNTAIADLVTAYNDAAGRVNPDFTNLASGALGGLTLAPGLYNWASSVSADGDVTIQGGSSDTWIFQIDGTFTIAAGTSVILSGGALAENIVWVVADSVTTNAGAHLEGIVLGKTSVTLQTGTSANGRILAQTNVALQKATVVAPA